MKVSEGASDHMFLCHILDFSPAALSVKQISEFLYHCVPFRLPYGTGVNRVFVYLLLTLFSVTCNHDHKI